MFDLRVTLLFSSLVPVDLSSLKTSVFSGSSENFPRSYLISLSSLRKKKTHGYGKDQILNPPPVKDTVLEELE